MNEISKLNLTTLANMAKYSDKQALNELLERERKICEAYFKKQKLPLNDIQDLTQNVLIKIAKNIGNLKKTVTYPKWAKIITRNEFCDYIRNKNKNAVGLAQNNDFQEIINNTPDFTTNPLDEIINKELKKYVKNSVKYLPKEYKRAIIMRDIAGLSYSKIAEISKLNIGTVKSRIARAREKLKKIVKPYLEEL